MMVLSRWKSRKGSLAIGILAIITSTRYIFWRTTQTLSFGTPFEALFGTGLYLAELYAWVLLILGFLQTTWPLERPVVEIEGDPDTWPTVDVYIPTYNESLDIVRNTVFAAMDMDYPHDRFKVFILDDGRRPNSALCARGRLWLHHPRQQPARQGGQPERGDEEDRGRTDRDLRLRPRAHPRLPPADRGLFPEGREAGADADAALLLFARPGAAQLAVAKNMPAKVTCSMARCRAATTCGTPRSSAVQLRGHPPRSADGDQRLCRRDGDRGRPHRAQAATHGLVHRLYQRAPFGGPGTERLVLHIGQRIRWARGMTQILRIDTPLLRPGLKWQQRLCYLNAMLHFQFRCRASAS
jgi:cellulose synthase (UDP-forming)